MPSSQNQSALAQLPYEIERRSVPNAVGLNCFEYLSTCCRDRVVKQKPEQKQRGERETAFALGIPGSDLTEENPIRLRQLEPL
jgi:hypothetical protein